MDPQLLQSMLPNRNSSEEVSSEPTDISEEANEPNDEADSSVDNASARMYEEYDDSYNAEVKPNLRTSRLIKINKQKTSHSQKLKSEKVNAQHQKRLAELMEYLETHMMSTLYFHEEMKRILEQRKVKDPLRRMVTVLEHEPYLKEKVMACYTKYKTALEKSKDLWKHPTNDLVINLVHDY